MPRLFNVDELLKDDSNKEGPIDDSNNAAQLQGQNQNEEERAKNFLSTNFITKEEFDVVKRDLQNLKNVNNLSNNGGDINTSETVVEFIRRPGVVFSDKETLIQKLVDYYWESDIFSLEECNYIKNLSTKQEFDFGKTENSEDEKPDISVRNNQITWIPINDETLWVYERINDVVCRANKEKWNFNLAGFYEDIQYSIYKTNEDGDSHYTWHMDIGSEYPMNYRKISVSIQITEESEYDGGDLQLNQGGSDITAIKNAGSGLIFPSYMLHRVMPITRGRRESMQLWVSGVPFQ